MTEESRGRSRSVWIPPLLIGVATAVAAEVSIAVLLYGGPGFTRSLTTALVVQALALAAGLATRGSEPGRGLRRRWLLSLTAYLAATAFSTLWTVVPAVGNNRLGQGLGLAALAALPLYTCGALLAGLSTDASSFRRGDRGAGHGRGPAIASTATFGAALGFVGTGLLLPRAPMPASLLVACLVLLSLGGMIHSSGVAGRDGAEAEPEPDGPSLPAEAGFTRVGEDPPTS